MLVNTLNCSGLKKCIVEYKVDWIKKFQNQKRLVTPFQWGRGGVGCSRRTLAKGGNGCSHIRRVCRLRSNTGNLSVFPISWEAGTAVTMTKKGMKTHSENAKFMQIICIVHKSLFEYCSCYFDNAEIMIILKITMMVTIITGISIWWLWS